VDNLGLEIITPERVVVRDVAEIVEARGALGEFGVLSGHIQFLTTIEIGEIRYVKDGSVKCLATSGGFAEVYEDKITLLVDTAEFAAEIDVDRAKRALSRAETALKELAQEEEEYRRHELALQRAITRISAASRIE
jgi:F-type H+-transporting ATPase subunit epsilon